LRRTAPRYLSFLMATLEHRGQGTSTGHSQPPSQKPSPSDPACSNSSVPPIRTQQNAGPGAWLESMRDLELSIPKLDAKPGRDPRPQSANAIRAAPCRPETGTARPGSDNRTLRLILRHARVRQRLIRRAPRCRLAGDRVGLQLAIEHRHAGPDEYSHCSLLLGMAIGAALLLLDTGETSSRHGASRPVSRSGTARAVRFRVAARREPSGFVSKSIYHRTACAVPLREIYPSGHTRTSRAGDFHRS
jgi:hypothetical protein